MKTRMTLNSIISILLSVCLRHGEISLLHRKNMLDKVRYAIAFLSFQDYN